MRKRTAATIMIAIVVTGILMAGCKDSTSALAGSSQTDVAKKGGTPDETASLKNEAESYPKEPVRLIVPFAAGGGGDTMVRTIEPYWAEQLGGNFSIENMGGSGTQIGMTEIYNSGDDPYVVGVISQPHTSLTIDVQGAPYTLDDFYCINLHNFDPQSVFVTQDKEWNDFNELVNYIKAHPGEVSFGVSQMTGGHLWTAFMAEELNLDITIVPYDGGSTCRTAMLGGIIDVMVMNEAASSGMENTKCLGVNWTESRLWENAKTISELLPGSKVAEVGIACANYKFVGVNAKMKEEHSEIFEKLVETYRAAYQNEEHMKICEGQGLSDYMKWYGPEESQKLWYSIQEISSQYSFLFK